jgi:hypothetical protein
MRWPCEKSRLRWIKNGRTLLANAADLSQRPRLLVKRTFNLKVGPGCRGVIFGNKRSTPNSPTVSGRFCTVAQHVVIDLSCLRLGLRRDLPWTTIVPNDDEGELGLGHLDALTAPVPEHPNFHI